MPQAAKLLAFLAYLDHQDIWYSLLRVALDTDRPLWFTDLTGDEFLFEQAMTTLARYCLVESHYQTGSYSLHVYVHDWTLNGLNQNIDISQYWLAFDCIAGHIHLEDWHNLSALRYRRLTPHVVRLTHECFRHVGGQQEWLQSKLKKAQVIGELLYKHIQYNAAEQMYLRVLGGYEKALGPDYTSTLSAVNDLGRVYRSQGRLAEAKQMYMRALAGKEKALGPNHSSTLNIVNNLGQLYRDQGKWTKAEQMYMRALNGMEKALGPDHTLTLYTVNNLGNLYCDQGKLAEAEQMYGRALAGKEKMLGPDHPSTLSTVHNLGRLYRIQGKLAEAEQMYMRALAGREKTLGPDHGSTLDTVDNLGLLYYRQGKLAEAEQMYVRALARKEKALGPDHTSTLSTANNLRRLYCDQGRLDEAEQMHQRTLGLQNSIGSEHPNAMIVMNNTKTPDLGNGEEVADRVHPVSPGPTRIFPRKRWWRFKK